MQKHGARDQAAVSQVGHRIRVKQWITVQKRRPDHERCSQHNCGAAPDLESARPAGFEIMEAGLRQANGPDLLLARSSHSAARRSFLSIRPTLSANLTANLDNCIRLFTS